MRTRDETSYSRMVQRKNGTLRNRDWPRCSGRLKLEWFRYERRAQTCGLGTELWEATASLG